MWAMVLGGYPRSRYARYTARDLDAGRLPLVDGAVRLSEASALVVGVQVAAGMRYVTDGLLDWHDVFRPFAESWRNVSLDGLIRYFDNNFFYRIPVFHGEPEPQRLVLPSRVEWARRLAEPASVKVIVPGPLTMARLGRNESDLDDEELVMRIASALAEEVRASVRSGATFVQVDEPFLADIDATADDAQLAVEAIRILKKAADRAPVSLAVYFDAPKPEVYRELIEAPVDYISLDIVDARERARKLVGHHGCGGKKPIIGIVNARHLMDDDFSIVKEDVEVIYRSCETDEIGLTTSTWLDLIPHRFSIRKTLLLGVYTEKIAQSLGLEYYSPVTEKPEAYIA